MTALRTWWAWYDAKFKGEPRSSTAMEIGTRVHQRIAEELEKYAYAQSDSVDALSHGLWALGRLRDPLDDLTPEQCLERYIVNQRADGPPEWLLTPAQRNAARELWSAQLRTRVAESTKLDATRAVSVVVDYEED